MSKSVGMRSSVSYGMLSFESRRWLGFHQRMKTRDASEVPASREQTEGISSRKKTGIHMLEKAGGTRGSRLTEQSPCRDIRSSVTALRVDVTWVRNL